MKLDFTIKTYKLLIESLLNRGYKFLTVKNYFEQKNNSDKICILRHDVDKKPINSLQKAVTENRLGIYSTYYFRIVKESFNEEIIIKIAKLGHEIGFHYEDLTLAKGNYEEAIMLFTRNLAKLRELYPVVTICMHGSPTSKWNNLDIWNYYDYKQFGIIAEPNFDLNFNEVFYLTDTGMSWNLSKYAVRDVPKGNFDVNIKSSNDILNHLELGTLPGNIMLNTHPQRWSDNILELAWEKSTQMLKNQIKRFIKRKI